MSGDVLGLCHQILSLQTTHSGQVLAVTSHGDLLSGQIVPVTMTLRTVNVPEAPECSIMCQYSVDLTCTPGQW